MPYRENNYVPEERNKLEVKLESLTWSDAGEYCFIVLSKFLKRKIFAIEKNISETAPYLNKEMHRWEKRYTTKFCLYIFERNNKIDITEKVSSEWPKDAFSMLEKEKKDESSRRKRLINEELDKKRKKDKEKRDKKKRKLEVKIEKKLNKLLGE